MVAVELPLSRALITYRIACDNAASRTYGTRKCSTHSPNADRPGSISDDLRREFLEQGCPLINEQRPRRRLIEAYPPLALVKLANAPERLPYKAGKARVSWKHREPVERLQELLRGWRGIISQLEE
jgi:predicted RNase H-like nuclease